MDSRRKRSSRNTPTPSQLSRRQFNDQTSRQFDRARIQKELDDLFSCGQTNNDENDSLQKTDILLSTPPRKKSSSSLLEDADVGVLETSKLQDKRDDQEFRGKIPLLGGSLFEDSPLSCDLYVKSEDRHRYLVQKQHAFSDEELESEKKETRKMNQELKNTQAEIHEHFQDREKVTPHTLYNNNNDQDQTSVMDGFSIVHGYLPQREIIISVDKEHQIYNRFRGNSKKYKNGRDDKNHNDDDDAPPDLLTISMDSSTMTPSEDTMHTSKSQLSYDDTSMITPSISFFLNANKQELNNEGLSIANEDHHQHRRHLRKSPTSVTDRKLYSSSSLLSIGDDLVDDEDNESQTAVGYSKASSKYTTDTPRILELREKKRLMERHREKKYPKFPSLIEVSQKNMKGMLKGT